MLGIVVVAALMAQEYSPPEGPDGLVYRKDWENTRLAIRRQGTWDTWRLQAIPGNGGAPVTLRPAESAQVDAQLRAIAQVLESTPTAQALRGWYARRTVAWTRTRFPTERFTVARLPVESFYAFYPFHLMDRREVRNGVSQWVPEWAQETIAMTVRVNGPIPEPLQRPVLEEAREGRALRWFAGVEPEGTFQGYPVHGGDAVIAHNGRPLYVPVGLARALDAYLPRYRADVQGAEERLRGYQQRQAETASEAFAATAMADFEREYGAWKATRPSDYDFRRRTRLAWIERMRQEARDQAAPREGTAEGRWYWEPVRALQEAQRLAARPDGGEAACFEVASPGTALFRAIGHVRPAGSGTACLPLLEANPAYYDEARPRTAPQLLTLGRVDRCVDVRTQAPVGPVTAPVIPHGCTVHRAVWAEMDWRRLEAMVAR